MPIISAKNLIKKYPNPELPGETFFAVKDVNLNIEEGEIFGLLGPNGAGKTTTLEMLEGLNNFDEGSIEIDGIDVLDEPTTGLDPQAKRNLWQLAKTLNENGMTIVITTHNMEEAEFLCDRIAIMDQGSIIAQDTPQQLIADHAAEIPERRLQGNLEDVFLNLTGLGLRE